MYVFKLFGATRDLVMHCFIESACCCSSISHTTRPAIGEEINGRDYNFVSLDEFENEIKAVCYACSSHVSIKYFSHLLLHVLHAGGIIQLVFVLYTPRHIKLHLDEFIYSPCCCQGKFLQTYAYHGELFGLTIDSIEGVAKEGLACVVHMELEGVLTLKNTYFEPRYVLCMPLDRYFKHTQNGSTG